MFIYIYFIVCWEDEQEREITMKSSSIALRWLSPRKEDFLVPES